MTQETLQRGKDIQDKISTFENRLSHLNQKFNGFSLKNQSGNIQVIFDTQEEIEALKKFAIDVLESKINQLKIEFEKL